MTHNADVRSKQRFQNFGKAFILYEQAASQKLSRLEEEGLVHRFEYTFELAWKCLQDLLVERGYLDIRGPRPVIEQAFQDGIITDGPKWLAMLKARNQTTHIYDESTFEAVIKDIQGPYLKIFKDFNKSFPK